MSKIAQIRRPCVRCAPSAPCSPRDVRYPFALTVQLRHFRVVTPIWTAATVLFGLDPLLLPRQMSRQRPNRRLPINLCRLCPAGGAPPCLAFALSPPPPQLFPLSVYLLVRLAAPLSTLALPLPLSPFFLSLLLSGIFFSLPF